MIHSASSFTLNYKSVNTEFILWRCRYLRVRECKIHDTRIGEWWIGKV